MVLMVTAWAGQLRAAEGGGNWRYTGTVVDEAGRAVAGAKVWVDGAVVVEGYSPLPNSRISGRAARACFSAWTGADGRFRLDNFPADAQAQLAVHRAGQVQYPMGNALLGWQQARSGETNVQLLLGPAGVVEGKVVIQETGQPLAGVSVWLQSKTFENALTEPVQSGADGTFHIPDVRPDPYYVLAAMSDPGADRVVENAYEKTVAVRAGETVSNAVIQASAGALVEVTVVNTNTSEPLTNVAVKGGQSTAYTGPDGVARLRVPAGKNWFSARSDWHRQNITAEIRTGQTNEVRLELIPPPHITGTVRDADGVAVAGAVVLYHAGHYYDAPDDTDTMTDKNGRYELILKTSRETLAWGTITPTSAILARSVERNLAALTEVDTLATRMDSSGHSVPMEENETYPTHLDLTLKPGIALTGSVQDMEGKPISNACVMVRVETGRSSAKVLERPIQVDAQGAFAIPALPQGRAYDVFDDVTARGYGTVSASLEATKTRTNRAAFPPFVLKRADQILAGQVLGPDDKPLAGARVELFGDYTGDLTSALSDRQGRFVFNGVCAGEVQLAAYANSAPGPGQGGQMTADSVKAQVGETNVVVRVR